MHVVFILFLIRIIVLTDDTFIIATTVLLYQDFCNQYMCELDLKGDIPVGWWITANKNCHYLLAALVHRNNPDIIPEPTDADAGATRENIRNNVAASRADEAAAAKVAPQTNKGKIEESMMSSKAVLMQQSVQLQETEGVKEQLMMMKEFKSSFVNIHNSDSGDGEAEYDATVCAMLRELPIMKMRNTNRDPSDGGSASTST